MQDNDSLNVKTVLFEMIKTRFAGFSFWSIIESDIAVFCADLVEPVDTEKTKQFVNQLKQIKNFFLGHSVSENELIFLDEEIERHEKTKTISLYEEEDDEVKEEDIEYYARHGGTTEGVVGIHLPYNYVQLNNLTNGVFKKTGLIKFYISREKTIYGKIVAEIYEHSQSIPIAALIESNKKNKETGEPVDRRIALFGSKFDNKMYRRLKEIDLPFFVYRFISEDNKEMILMSPTACEIGDYIVTGVQTQCDDYKMLTDSAKLPTKLPFFFAQKVMNRIIKFKNHGEFNNRINSLHINRHVFYNYPFTIKKKNRLYNLLQPNWYKLLIWAWITHQPKGLFNNYPMHLLVMGPKHSGKSLLLNGLHEKSKESKNVFSGSSSTLKSLIPSFKGTPAKLGYLAESNRFAFCDEFFRCLISIRSRNDRDQKEESVAMMNDLLEHQKREAGSGVSRVNVNMTSRILATTNPIRGINNISDLLKSFDESFLSRWVLYYQTKEHVSMIRQSKDSDLTKNNFRIPDTDWIALIDYLHTFSADYDMDIVEKIHAEIPSVLNETLNKHYDARHKHHIECLIDGLIKTRCMLDGDMSFKANKEDYKNLKLVWGHIVGSWIDPIDIKHMDLKKRINYMPEKSQYIYWHIVDLKRPTSKLEIEKFALKDMNKAEFYESLMVLINNELLKDENGIVKPYFMEDKLYEVKQSKL